jgi:hypothetical protein
LGITRHQITSFSIVNDTDNVGQLILIAKQHRQIIFRLRTGDADTKKPAPDITGRAFRDH